MMRNVFLFILLVFVAGCSFNIISAQNAKFNVSIVNASHSESFDVEKNKTIDSVAFTMLNDADFVFNCSVVLELDNTTNVYSHRAAVGSLLPGVAKKVNLSFEMFSGNTSLRIVPDCQKAD